MRRYVIALWILSILFIFHFAVAAPVVVSEVLKVRSNAVVVKDGITSLEKRMDPDPDKNGDVEGNNRGGDDYAIYDADADNYYSDSRHDDGDGKGYASNFDADSDNYYNGDDRHHNVGSGNGNDYSGNDSYDGDDDNTEHAISSDSEHPAPQEHNSFLVDLIKSVVEFMRPGSGAVGTP